MLGKVGNTIVKTFEVYCFHNGVYGFHNGV